MSLFDSASLVITPNGVKEDKLYAIKPTDGSGDLVVTRATTATRVNSDGLIEVVPYNLLTFSNTFTNAAWTKNNATITANSIANPINNLVDANIITANSNVGYINSSSFYLSIGQYTISMFAKKINTNFCSIEISDGISNSGKAWYNLTNGANGTTGGTYSVSNQIAISYDNGWYLLQLTINVTSAGNYFFVPFFCQTNGSLSQTNDAGYAYGCQVVTGTSAKEYFPTTDRLDVPRLDYTNSSCPSILVEPQRTNLATYSEQFDDASWTKSSATITANTSVAPTGNTTADTLTITSGGYLLQTLFGYNAVSGQSITISIFAKNQISDFLKFGGATIAGNDVYTIQDYGNGWYRHIRTRTFTTSNPAAVIQFIIFDTIGTHIVWGAQMEANSTYATSYIPTIASSVTRNADVISKTGISSLIGQTEGTLFVDVILGNENAEMYLILQNILGNVIEDSIYIQRNTNELKFVGWDGYDLNWNISGGSFTTGQRVKIAAAYKANDVVLYVNGTQIGTDSVATIPPTTSLALGYFPYTPSSEAERAKNINSAILWKTRLSNTELATLTTI